MQNGAAVLEMVWQFRNVLNTKLTQDPVILILDIFSGKLKLVPEQKGFTQMFLVALYR